MHTLSPARTNDYTTPVAAGKGLSSFIIPCPAQSYAIDGLTPLGNRTRS